MKFRLIPIAIICIGCGLLTPADGSEIKSKLLQFKDSCLEVFQIKIENLLNRAGIEAIDPERLQVRVDHILAQENINPDSAQEISKHIRNTLEFHGIKTSTRWINGYPAFRIIEINPPKFTKSVGSELVKRVLKLQGISKLNSKNPMEMYEVYIAPFHARRNGLYDAQVNRIFLPLHVVNESDYRTISDLVKHEILHAKSFRSYIKSIFRMLHMGKNTKTTEVNRIYEQWKLLSLDRIIISAMGDPIPFSTGNLYNEMIYKEEERAYLKANLASSKYRLEQMYLKNNAFELNDIRNYFQLLKVNYEILKVFEYTLSSAIHNQSVLEKGIRIVPVSKNSGVQSVKMSNGVKKYELRVYVTYNNIEIQAPVFGWVRTSFGLERWDPVSCSFVQYSLDDPDETLVLREMVISDFLKMLESALSNTRERLSEWKSYLDYAKVSGFEIPTELLDDDFLKPLKERVENAF